MTDLLECPVCMAIMHPPIHQCFNGHTICFTCKAKVNNICPICRQELGNIRCLALEKVAERIDLPCKFHLFGCPRINSYNNALKHEQICSFRPFNCPYNSSTCLVTGEFHTVNYVDVADGSTFNIIYKMININRDNWTSSLCNCFGHQFYIHLEAVTFANAPLPMHLSCVKAFLRFMGNKREAKKFRYSLEVGGRDRKLKWQGVPRSIREDEKTIRNSCDGLVIQLQTALFFSDKGLERNLNVAARIWRV